MKATHDSAAKPRKPRGSARTPTAPAMVPADVPVGGEPGGDLPGAQEREACLRRTAYAYFEARGRVHGHELDDWLRAEADFEQMVTGRLAPPAH